MATPISHCIGGMSQDLYTMMRLLLSMYIV